MQKSEVNFLFSGFTMVSANGRVLGEEADKQDHIPDVSKKVTKKKQTLI